MTIEQLPAGASGNGDHFPAQSEAVGRRDVTQHRAAGSLSLDLMDERRDGDPSVIDLLAYWRVLMKRRRLIASVLAGCVAVSLLITLMTQPLYRASAMMQIEKEGPPIVAGQGGGASLFSTGWDPEFLTTQYQLLRSRALAERVANEMNLSAETLASLNDPGWIERVMALVRPAAKAKVSETTDIAGPKRAEALLKQATGVIRGGLSVQPVPESRLVNLSFDSPDPNFSARVVNAIAEGFIASSLERRMGTTYYAKTYLEDQLAQTKTKL